MAAILAGCMLALACLALMTFRLNLPWRPAGAALALGLGGFAATLPADEARTAPPVLPAPRVNAAALLAARHALSEGRPQANSWIVIADAFARHDQFAEAAAVLGGAVEKDADNALAWLALGDALYAHHGGWQSPAATFAYRHADLAAVRSGGAIGLVATAMEQSGRSALAAAWRRRSLSDSGLDARRR